MIAVEDVPKQTTTLVGAGGVVNEGGGGVMNLYYKKVGLEWKMCQHF